MSDEHKQEMYERVARAVCLVVDEDFATYLADLLATGAEASEDSAIDIWGEPEIDNPEIARKKHSANDLRELSGAIRSVIAESA